MGLNDTVGNRQSEAGAACGGFLSSLERFKDDGLVFRRDANAGVDDLESNFGFRMDLLIR